VWKVLQSTKKSLVSGADMVPTLGKN